MHLGNLVDGLCVCVANTIQGHIQPNAQNKIINLYGQSPNCFVCLKVYDRVCHTMISSSRPEGSRVIIEDDDNVVGRLLQLLPCRLTVPQSVDELLIWILIASSCEISSPFWYWDYQN